MDKLNDNENFDVNSWIKLYKECPDTFEKKRQEMIERTISEAPESTQRRLRGLQFEIDGIRRTSSNPMSACIAISKKMFDKLAHLKDVIDGNIDNNTHKIQKSTADILNFELKTTEE